MALRSIDVSREWHAGAGECTEGLFCLGDAVENLEALLPEYEGKVKLVYMDPPFMTGDRFFMRVRVGEAQWVKGRGGMALETFSDKLSREEYLGLLRRVLELCHRLLSDEGMIFVHIDYRAHPHGDRHGQGRSEPAERHLKTAKCTVAKIIQHEWGFPICFLYTKNQAKVFV